MPHKSSATLTAHPAATLKGDITVPGDKSISHRALILGGMAVGETRIEGLLEGEDVHATAAAMAALGAEVERLGPGSWRVFGRGVGGLAEPDQVLDLGNSGTGVRLLMGAVTGQPHRVFFTGDASLRRRPMRRVTEPLEQMGARIVSRSEGRLPLVIDGCGEPLPIDYRTPVASAQIKSAILLAALAAPGRTTVIESRPSRDHTERMLRHFGATVEVAEQADGAIAVSLDGQPELQGRAIAVPGDPSSAAFPIVAACLRPGSELMVRGICLNPLRDGLFRTLKEMGADIEILGIDEQGSELVGDIRVRGGALRGVTVPPERAATMIDEYPVLSVAAAFAEGTTTMRGIGELRVKESDRIAAMAAGLRAAGVEVEEFDDGFAVHGRARPPKGGAAIESHLDHRIAMSFLVLGSAAEAAVTVNDAAMIDTSFPGFVALMNSVGADIRT
ncbi:3-phosphoshikimate 1-carboxyvinyltransferase [Oceanibacterium hippocampi]|uniref:3-phosphoshikimate 1-carboxyvinyltransferase n=1 Tax=Oceanibacterium hippocampi TaxID=745714 RepID=A0A1Y5RPP9_9PROT|nr:3-phosphoshikimate 1-carboxyvinyltransferase [Oceanibacterium hippocampi]SLN22491.1 3-phosphoshikimate 1-carboxyvinyltransferase [Oceanibacterium hippocampi]